LVKQCTVRFEGGFVRCHVMAILSCKGWNGFDFFMFCYHWKLDDDCICGIWMTVYLEERKGMV